MFEGKVESLKTGEKIFKLDSYGIVLNPRDFIGDGALFNGGAVQLRGKTIIAPRCHRGYRKFKFFDEGIGKERYGFEDYISEVWLFESNNFTDFEFSDVVIRAEEQDFKYGIEDIRIVEHNDFYILVGCGKVKPPFKGKGDRPAIYTTSDFRKIKYHGIIDLESRNAIPFFDGRRWYMLMRFHPSIYLIPVELEYILEPLKHKDAWLGIFRRKDDYLLFKAGDFPHEIEKIGPSTPLIRTEIGWLFIYHAVGKLDRNIFSAYGLDLEVERGYSVCVALLDLDAPHKVIARGRRPIYIPSKPYELFGNDEYPVDIPCVVFPVGAICQDDELLLYCGAGDKYEILLGCNIENLLEFLKMLHAVYRRSEVVR